MNLIDMSSRKDPNLKFIAKSKYSILNWKNKRFRGFEFESSSGHIIEIKAPFRHFPYSSDVLETGWKIIPLGKHSRNATIQLEIVDINGMIIGERSFNIKNIENEVDVLLPALPNGYDKNNVANLRVYLKGNTGFFNLFKARIFLGVHQALDRRTLLDQCTGIGVEIGPGHSPQVQPSSTTEVYFIEQMSPSQWNELYNKEGKYNVNSSLWKFYKIGEAHNLPVEDNSLDFIFSSHVFEHLANPLGHLTHWWSKLKKGGRILAIVPDLGGCKDYVYQPSKLSEIEGEWQDGNLFPSIKHYERWAKFRAPGQDPESFMKVNRSIHCHFYTKSNISQVLEYAVKNLDFSHYEVIHTPNHKDFFFILEK